jgi:hypothetical protein
MAFLQFLDGKVAKPRGGAELGNGPKLTARQCARNRRSAKL